MKSLITLFAILLLTTSCGVFSSLNSNTSIKPKESFVLGNNKHGSFKTHLKNEGVTILKIYQTPINGGSHSSVLIKPQETTTIKTEKNTALIIENTGDEYASVTLKVKGDLNLGMNYK
jgi:hypothetical protein